MITVRLLRIARPTLFALVAFWAPAVAFSGSFVTSTRTDTYVPGRTDTDTFINADAESYVENTVDGGTFASSALAQLNGNLEVGVTLAPRLYFAHQSQAKANLTITQHYEAGDSRIGAVRFTVEPGEILFTTSSAHRSPVSSTACCRSV